MSVHLEELLSIKGVADSQLYTRKGELVLPTLPYQHIRIVSVGKEVAVYLEVLEKAREQIDLIEFVFPDRRLLVKPGANFFIVVEYDGDADIPLIKLAVNVVSEAIRGDKKMQKVLGTAGGSQELLHASDLAHEWRSITNVVGLR